MDTLTLKPRRPVEEEIESWDDGDFMVDGDDITMRSTSTTANAPSAPSSRRRDSNSSHMSLRSELESWAGEEEKQLHIPDDDEKSTLDAISAAQSAGIPLPQNVPSSALMGGTIKRLGGRKMRKILHEDWEGDLELPDVTEGLKMKAQTDQEFPETLRQVSGGSVQASPTKSSKSPAAQVPEDRRASGRSSFGVQSTPVNLDKFKDADDDDDFFGEGCETIKVSKRPTKPVSLITPPTPQKPDEEKQPQEDDFEADLELPTHGTLKLSTRRDIPKTPSSQGDDLDWGEGSLGTRHGGTRRDARSTRSSSASALSPSVSSSITAESEDETFDGLVLPPGPVNFQEMLQKRRKSRSPARIPEEPSPPKKASPAEADRPGFLDGLDIGDGDVFNAGKLTLHRNVKVKDTQPNSPARPKTAISLTFTNKQPSASSRLPRLSHERTHSTSLEPVSESGGPILQRARRPQSRLGHSAKSSETSIPTPTTPSSSGSQWSPGTPGNRREIGSKTSTPSLRNEPTTTNSQLLKQKRSLPAIRALNPPTRPLSFRHDRPPSRTDSGRPPSGMRPKTPVERQRLTGSESPALARKNTLPFLPAGASSSKSRPFRRHDSDNSIDLRPNSRTVSRSAMRSPSPHRYKVAADTWERLSRPKGRKNFGDGHELDAFDDLPTSKESEGRFLKQPASASGKAPLRTKMHQYTMSASERISTPTPTSSFSQPPKPTPTPRFARDTTASRIARETSLAHRSTSSTGGPLAQINAQRGAPLSVRGNANTQHLQQPSSIRSKKSVKRPPQLKPHLISNLNNGKESKMIDGMFYNPETFRWEGNENALNIFDAAATTPTTNIANPLATKEKETPPPRPALITNFSATKGVQVVNGMVFDPESMCWLKLDAQKSAKSDTSDPMDKFNALQDDDDVFKDIPDLEDAPADEDKKKHGRVSDINDDWLVGEEFDVGPEFVRRQREEEERWRKKCDKWAGRGVRDREAWRWTIRELVSQFDDLPM